MNKAWCAALVGVAGALACGRQHSDPPPAQEKLEVASAAPGALGALAAGTDAAPPPPARSPRRTWHVPGDEEEEILEPEEEQDGGLPEAGQGPAEVPL